MIKLGTLDIEKIYLGTAEVKKVYKGDDVVFDNSVAPLPYDAELQYLQSSGAQYIDLGKKATTSTKIEVKFSLSNTVTQAVYGSAESNYGCFFGTSATSVVFCNFTNDPISPSRTLSANTDYTVIQNGTSLKINSWNNTVKAPRATTYNLALFARRLSGEVQRNMSGKLYYFKMYNGNDLVLDLIPVSKNNVGYMYDRVSGELFGNDGTGSFTLGPVVQ